MKIQAVDIDIVGLPMNSAGEVMWVQEFPNGQRMVRLADMEFGNVILESLARAHQEEMRRREAELFKGVQGVR